MTYSEKLRDPRWQKRRLEIMERDKFTCLHCGDTKSTLNVHHALYEKGKAPWDYPDHILFTLCERCHEYAEIVKNNCSVTYCGMTKEQRNTFITIMQILGDRDAYCIVFLNQPPKV